MISIIGQCKWGNQMFFNAGRENITVAVISAHPDDETLGAGGTIAKHAEYGDEIHSCIVTKAYTPDWQEEFINIMRDNTQKALKHLGISDIQFLEFPTVKLNAVPGKELNDRIQAFINDCKPQVIYAPFPGDLNSDHGIVARSTAIAARPLPGTRRSLLYYETLSSTEWGRIFLGGGFEPNIYIDISSTLETKLKAAEYYENEMKPYPHPRSLDGIKTLARLRGVEVGIEAAEAYHLALNIS